MIETLRRVLLAFLVLAGVSLTVADPAPGQAAPGSSAPAEAVTVYLHRTAVLEGSEFTLAEVASLYSSDPLHSAELGQLPLGVSPTRPTLLPGRLIRERIAAVAGEAAVIGGRVAVLPAAAIPAEQRWFYAALLAFVEDRDPYKQGRIEIEPLEFPLLLTSPVSDAVSEQGMASGWKDRIVFHADTSPYSAGSRSTLSYHDIPSGTMRISYSVLAAGTGGSTGLGRSAEQDLEGTFRIWVHHFLPVARAAVDLPADQALTEQSVVFREEDVSILQSDAVVLGDEIRGYKTLSSLKRGERIDGRRLQRVLAVRAGDRVMITFARPGLEVSLPGRALRSGSVGDVIDVRPYTADKRLQARVTTKGEVRVENR